MADETNNQTQNETVSKETYEAIKQDLEAERAKATGLVAEATKDLQAKVTSLETEVASKTQDIEALKGQLKTAADDFEGAKAAYAYAVEDFKKLAASANPLIPAEAIRGATIDEVKTSLVTAAKLVANVQASLSQKQTQETVPAGAPARTEADTSALSTKEKINLGLEKARQKKD